MRLALVFLLLTACGHDDRIFVDYDLATPTGPDLQLPPECPRAFQSPPYCFAGPCGTASTCGDCTNVGELCDYFEATLICAADHKWRCSWAGGTSGGCKPPPDGGACN